MGAEFACKMFETWKAVFRIPHIDQLDFRTDMPNPNQMSRTSRSGTTWRLKIGAALIIIMPAHYLDKNGNMWIETIMNLKTKRDVKLLYFCKFSPTFDPTFNCDFWLNWVKDIHEHLPFADAHHKKLPDSETRGRRVG